jgi:hypothetical protein
MDPEIPRLFLSPAVAAAAAAAAADGWGEAEAEEDEKSQVEGWRGLSSCGEGGVSTREERERAWLSWACMRVYALGHEREREGGREGGRKQSSCVHHAYVHCGYRLPLPPTVVSRRLIG